MIALAFCSSALAAPQSWDLQNGQWVPVAAQPVAQPVQPDPVLDEAEDLLARGDHSTARKLLLNWVKTHKVDDPQRDRAVFLFAQVYFQSGDRIRSFYHCDELMDSFQDSPLFYRALELQYRIADAYLRGYKRTFLGLPILSAEDEAVEMLFRIQNRSPGSPIAEKALLRTADYYYASSDFDLAGDAYGAYVRSYSRSPLVPKVRLRQAFCSLARFRGLPYDATPLIDARAQLVDVINSYPDLAEQENLRAILERIDGSFAQKIALTADFYRRTHDLSAAAYHYRFLIKTYPKSDEAKRAREQLRSFPAEALKVPEPPAGNGYAPATQPLSEAR